MADRPVHPTNKTTRILMFLSGLKGRWATWGPSMYMPSVQAAMDVGTTEKQQLKFMQKLQKKGLVGGCDCGCRGDYVLTPKGVEMLAEDSLHGSKYACELLEAVAGSAGLIEIVNVLRDDSSETSKPE